MSIEPRIIGLVFGTLVILWWIWHYGRAGLDGIRFRKMRYRGLTSWQFNKFYELEGDAALLCGILFIALSSVCFVGWAVSLLRVLTAE